MLRKPRPAARTPRHHIPALIQPALLMAGFEKMPDGIVILVRLRMIRIAPVHPIPQPDGLLRDNVGEPVNAPLAQIHELAHPKRLYIALGLKAQLLFHLHLDPQPLPVEPILKALVVPLHRPKAQEHILIRPPPGVMHPHRIIGGNRPIDKRISPIGPLIARHILPRYPPLLPPPQHLALHSHKIGLRINGIEHSCGLLVCSLIMRDG